MMEVFLALVGGLFVGVLFTLIKLPIPAPPVLSGIAGIIGIFAGAKIVEFIQQTFF